MKELIENLWDKKQLDYSEYDAIAFDNIEDLKDHHKTQLSVIDLLDKLLGEKKTVLLASTGKEEDIPEAIYQYICQNFVKEEAIKCIS